jgi:hypothetical protein
MYTYCNITICIVGSVLLAVNAVIVWPTHRKHQKICELLSADSTYTPVFGKNSSVFVSHALPSNGCHFAVEMNM